MKEKKIEIPTTGNLIEKTVEEVMSTSMLPYSGRT